MCGGRLGGVQEGGAPAGSVDDGSAGVWAGAGRDASRGTRHRARGRRGGSGAAVRRARSALVAAATAMKAAYGEAKQAMCRAVEIFVADQAAETRQLYAALRMSVEEYERWRVERGDASARAMAAAFDPVEAAGRNHGRACEAFASSCAVYRDAKNAAAAVRQHRLAERRRKERCGTGQSAGVGLVDAPPLPVGIIGGAGGDRCVGGERVEESGSAAWLEAGRRGRAAVGRLLRGAVPAEGGRGGWLEGAGSAGPMPAAWGRPSRAWGVRGRRLGRCAPSWQQVGQPPGRPPGCHRGAGCPVGRGKLGRGLWLGDGC